MFISLHLAKWRSQGICRPFISAAKGLSSRGLRICVVPSIVYSSHLKPLSCFCVPISWSQPALQLTASMWIVLHIHLLSPNPCSHEHQNKDSIDKVWDDVSSTRVPLGLRHIVPHSSSKSESQGTMCMRRHGSPCDTIQRTPGWSSATTELQ